MIFGFYLCHTTFLYPLYFTVFSTRISSPYGEVEMNFVILKKTSLNTVLSKNMRKGVIILFILLGAVTSTIASPTDSLRTESKEGKTYVIHRVEPGQTLYAVMRKYKTTIQALKDANPGMNEGLVTGQMVRVPRAAKSEKVVESPKKIEKAEEKIIISPQKPVEESPKKPEKIEKKIVIDTQKPVVESPKKIEKAEEKIVIAPQKPVEENPKKVENVEESPKKLEEVKEIPKKTEKAEIIVSKNGLHKVEAGQSLYGIAVKYGVLMTDIRRWNNLAADQLRSGQELVVSEQAYHDSLKNVNKDSAKIADLKPNTDKTLLPTPVPALPENANLPEPKIANTGKRIIESGMAEVIDAADNSTKYLALHRTAPVGSLIQVKNLGNNQSIWVKVIGKLPSISANDRIIIKISARAQEKLSPNGKRFLSEISYLGE